MRFFARLAVVLVVGLVVPLLGACTSSSRAGRLMTIAAEEAAGIDTLDNRLARQLNIADLQIQAGQKAEALKTLSVATVTLKLNEKDPKLAISDFRRIAGWTSVAQLSRRAGDDKAGSDAYFAAVEAINATKPATAAEYVLSLSQVCFEIRGKAETVALLVKGGEWARSVSDNQVRRYALWCYAQALVGYDDLEAARTVMRNEADATWRSGSLAALARQDMNNSRSGGGGAIFAGASTLLAVERNAEMKSQQNADSPATKIGTFNKSVQYEQNYRQSQIQDGYRPE